MSYDQKAEEKNKNMFPNKHIMISENNIGFLLVLFFAPNIINNLLHAMFFWTVYVYNFLTKWNTLVCC